MSDDTPTLQEEPEPHEDSTQPDDTRMHVRNVQLPDGRYCLLFTFENDDASE